MNNEFLQHNIEKRIKEELGAKDFSRVFNKSVSIENPKNRINIGSNNIYYLVNKAIDCPVEYRLIISSPDNFLQTSKNEYENSNLKINSFRKFIEVEVENYEKKVIPFKLEFLIISPEY